MNHNLVAGISRRGNRHECFQKGVGVGMNLPVRCDPYVPINRSTIFCGLSPAPPGYTHGTPADCNRKGVGVGISIQCSGRGGRGARGGRGLRGGRGGRG